MIALDEMLASKRKSLGGQMVCFLRRARSGGARLVKGGSSMLDMVICWKDQNAERLEEMVKGRKRCVNAELRGLVRALVGPLCVSRSYQRGGNTTNRIFSELSCFDPSERRVTSSVTDSEVRSTTQSVCSLAREGILLVLVMVLKVVGEKEVMKRVSSDKVTEKQSISPMLMRQLSRRQKETLDALMSQAACTQATLAE